jgi:hypothetical protein
MRTKIASIDSYLHNVDIYNTQFSFRRLLGLKFTFYAQFQVKKISFSAKSGHFDIKMKFSVF